MLAGTIVQPMLCGLIAFQAILDRIIGGKLVEDWIAKISKEILVFVVKSNQADTP
jgi:hypothetical protein